MNLILAMNNILFSHKLLVRTLSNGHTTTERDYGFSSSGDYRYKNYFQDSFRDIFNGEYYSEGYMDMKEFSNNKDIKILRDGLFQECIFSSEITLPTNLTYIGHGCFDDCNSLKEIIIPDRVEFIGEKAFRNCTSLSKIKLPNSLRFLLNGTFEKCSSLTEIYIPSNVTRIESECFKECKSLVNLIIPDRLNIDREYINLNPTCKITTYETKNQFNSDVDVFKIPELKTLLSTELIVNEDNKLEIWIKLNSSYEIDVQNLNRIKPKTNKLITEIFELDKEIKLYQVKNDVYYINSTELNTLDVYKKKLILNKKNLILDEI